MAEKPVVTALIWIVRGHLSGTFLAITMQEEMFNANKNDLSADTG
jgi:hypothetical protein